MVFLDDYVNRGPDVRGTLDFLARLQDTRPNTVFLAGNHDHALRKFLWPGSALKSVWSTLNMSMSSAVQRTFDSYGVRPAHRDDMLERMPERHQHFLQSLRFVHTLPGFVFVHGGLHSHKPVAEQLRFLESGAGGRDKPVQLFDHDDIYDAPDELLGSDTCVVSGHHGFVEFGPNRIVVDSIGSSNFTPLSCFMHPAFELLDDEGMRRTVDPAKVFPHRPPRQPSLPDIAKLVLA